MTPPLVLHADVDAFFASVVMRRRPDLVAVPFAVVAHVFIASANYVARGRGVRGGMSDREALTICPELIMIEVSRAEVEEASDALFDLFADCTRTVEPGSMEEGFLDVGTNDWTVARAAAQHIRSRAAAELSLPVSIGIGRTKLMAKLASRAAKPDGIHVIGPEEDARLRVELPLGETWGVGGRTLERLTQLNMSTLGDLDAMSDVELEQVCGVGMARRLRGFRDGTDDAVVRPVESRTTLTAEGAIAGFRRPDHTPAELLAASVARVCRRAARAGLVGTGIALTFRPLAGGSPIIRRRTYPDPTSDVEVWSTRAVELLEHEQLPAISGLGVTLNKLLPKHEVPDTLF